MKFLRALLTTFLVILSLYIVVVAVVGLLQHKLIFHPGKLPPDFAFDLYGDATEAFIKTTDGETINAIFYPGTNNTTILYFHGNAGDLSSWQDVHHDLAPLGHGLLIIDFRGYGKSTGTLSEDGLYQDAEAAYQYLLKEQHLSAGNIIIYGRSIGTGIAVELATRHDVKHLILESPYSSLKTLANEKVPYLLPSLVLRFSFNNLKKINSVQCPILFFHGAIDALIPVEHTNRLYDAFTGEKEKVIMPMGTHNNLSEFREYREGLKEVGL
ncbi:alpha/beta hydrolase [Chryseolinea lacunae]|uniref:Alpha/beta hydrolase n=1 Tax=Chryseolinea lacunae TaxID=2801331 RepID=A0ABS1KVK4_9BACT|nr:alpha/beta hydrolase [Chryseolinea lacunae]MBL0743475.1 alpha/beta hydrolase [Chryseolinea lacunae]